MTSPTAAPLLSIWFGNFFEPFYSDFDATSRGIAEVAELGFNAINLDSKPWEDFFARYRGEPASQYVRMHEYMMSEALARGLTYNHLALYLCGDNLYPNIRDVPPVRGEEAILPNGKPMGTYKYWSPLAQQSMIDHVKGLLALYRDGMTRLPGDRILMQTMFEPIPKPSFDAEGRAHYFRWLSARYDIASLCERYGIAKADFDQLDVEEYWLGPAALNWVDCTRPTAKDFATRSADFNRWIDNQAYLADVLNDYLRTMKMHWREIDPSVHIEPVLHQWGYFFNPPEQTMWQTGQRAMDIYRCAEHVDGVLFIASPLNAENRADAGALSVEASIARCANESKPFTGGVYLGRHVNADVYRVVPPAEAIATQVAAGAKRLHTYGYSGLDDGGVLFRMDELFKDSLKAGLRWANEVIPLLDSPRAKEVAMLFPAEMSLYEPLEVDEGGRHRMDLLGWYTQFTDLGWHVDILHPTQIERGGLSGYSHLVVPHNSLYDLGNNGRLEAAVKSFVEGGGTVIHGPNCKLAINSLGVEEEAIDFDCFQWDEEVIPHGWSTVAYRGGNAIATYVQSRKTAIRQQNVGAGRVLSFGFEYGYAYSRRTMPIVPPVYGKREMHPIVLLRETPVANLVGGSPNLPLKPMKGVEFARFGKRWIVVNHRASPIDLSDFHAIREWKQVPSAANWLAAHAATCLECK